MVAKQVVYLVEVEFRTKSPSLPPFFNKEEGNLTPILKISLDWIPSLRIRANFIEARGFATISHVRSPMGSLIMLWYQRAHVDSA